LTGILLAIYVPMQRWVLGTWVSDARVSRAVVVGVAASVAAGAVWKVVHAAPGARILLPIGLAIGLAILATR
jgi:hypothetical protein